MQRASLFCLLFPCMIRFSTALIISTYNNPRALNKILESISLGTILPNEILIADDGSTAATQLVVEKWASLLTIPVKHVWHEDKGYRRSKALNAALSQSESDYIIFLDGDCVPSKRFIEDHRLMAEKGCFVQGRRAFIKEEVVSRYLDGEVSLLSLFLRGKMTGLFKAIRWLNPIVKRNKDLHGVLGCNLGIWMKDLRKINGYDETFEGWGREDSDLAARLFHSGVERKLVYGRGIVYHLDHPILSRDSIKTNDQKLKETLETQKVWCDVGLSGHLENLEV